MTAIKLDQNDNDVLFLIKHVRKGVGYSFFKDVVEKSALSMNEWSSILHLSKRTLQRYNNEQKTFDPIYSEKILELAILFNKGILVFGDQDNFQNWINLENLALGGVKPKALFDNTFGINLVKDELGRIEHGIFS